MASVVILYPRMRNKAEVIPMKSTNPTRNAIISESSLEALAMVSKITSARIRVVNDEIIESRLSHDAPN